LKIVLDTNVYISAVFFGGIPLLILDAWRSEALKIVVSSQILDEYRRVSSEMTGYRLSKVAQPWIVLLEREAILANPVPVPHDACEDPKDLCFLAAALGGGAKVIVSGDKHLLHDSGFRGIQVLRPRAFVEEYIR
jgi:putative PIN family toxin of toxin-antitoxin system